MGINLLAPYYRNMALTGTMCFHIITGSEPPPMSPLTSVIIPTHRLVSYGCRKRFFQPHQLLPCGTIHDFSSLTILRHEISSGVTLGAPECIPYFLLTLDVQSYTVTALGAEVTDHSNYPNSWRPRFC